MKSTSIDNHYFVPLLPPPLHQISPMDPRNEFRAPPPSPAAGSRSSSEDDEFGGFLMRSLRVPELVLPDRILGRGSVPWNPPEIDFRSLEVEELRAAAASVGCFQIVNHGIAREVVEAVEILAGYVFRLPPEKRREVMGARERNWDFEEEEKTFWWSGGNEEQMPGIWPCGYKDFRGKLELLRHNMEKIAVRIKMVLLQYSAPDTKTRSPQFDSTACGSALFIRNNALSETCKVQNATLLQHETLQMLIRSSVYPSLLALHICRGASRFRVYSKKGCLQFPVKDKTIVITIGEQIQARSNGLYKHVAGKPIYENDEDSISMALLYSHPTAMNTCNSEERMISLTEQVMIAACLTILYHIIVLIWSST